MLWEKNLGNRSRNIVVLQLGDSRFHGIGWNWNLSFNAKLQHTYKYHDLVAKDNMTRNLRPQVFLLFLGTALRYFWNLSQRWSQLPSKQNSWNAAMQAPSCLYPTIPRQPCTQKRRMGRCKVAFRPWSRQEFRPRRCGLLKFHRNKFVAVFLAGFVIDNAWVSSNWF